MNTDCAYCMEGELVAKFGIKICELKEFLSDEEYSELIELIKKNL